MPAGQTLGVQQSTLIEISGNNAWQSDTLGEDICWTYEDMGAEWPFGGEICWVRQIVKTYFFIINEMNLGDILDIAKWLRMICE